MIGEVGTPASPICFPAARATVHAPQHLSGAIGPAPTSAQHLLQMLPAH